MQTCIGHNEGHGLVILINMLITNAIGHCSILQAISYGGNFSWGEGGQKVNSLWGLENNLEEMIGCEELREFQESGNTLSK